MILRIGRDDSSPTITTDRGVDISTPINSDEQGELPQLETPNEAVDPKVTQLEDNGAQQEEHTRFMPMVDKNFVTKESEPAAMVHRTADFINVSGDSSGPFATDDLDIADEWFSISMTEDDHRQIHDELENLGVRKSGRGDK